MVKRSQRSSMLNLSQITWNAFKPRSAHLEAVGQFILCKLQRSLCLGRAGGKGCPSGNNKTNTSANVNGAFRVECTLRHEAGVHSAMKDKSPIYPTP